LDGDFGCWLGGIADRLGDLGACDLFKGSELLVKAGNWEHSGGNN